MEKISRKKKKFVDFATGNNILRQIFNLENLCTNETSRDTSVAVFSNMVH